MRRRSPVVLALAVLAAAAARAEEPASAPEPPQLLGTWHGQYVATTASGTQPAELWLDISSQASTGGWTVRGHDRWNVVDGADGAPDATTSARAAEKFDTVSGQIDPGGTQVTFTEDTSGSRIEATLTTPDTLDAVYRPADGSPGFSVTLRRIASEGVASGAGTLGLDVSHHSGTVDWATVAAQGYRFAYVKASEGVDDADPMFAQHWQALAAAGMARGAYHFYVTEDDPVAQAKFFASRLGGDLGTLPPAVDVELLGANTTGDLTATLLTFLRTLEDELGVTPVIYTDSGFWDENYSPEFTAYPLWMAEYGVTTPRVPFGWTSWLLWQNQENQTVPGVESGADLDVLRPGVDLASLRPTPQ